MASPFLNHWRQALLVASLVCTGGSLHAENAFVPITLGSATTTYEQFHTLSNEDLEERARQMRENALTAQQRAMNHQWLAEHSGQDDAIHGKRAVSRLFQRSFKSYWNRKRDQHFGEDSLVPDSDGQGSIRSFDYDVHLSDDELELGIVYEF